MGIIPDPPGYCNHCAGCFPPNETPAVVKLFVSGIRTGGRWTPDFILPPNGYFDLDVEVALPCRWSGNFPGPIHIDLRSTPLSQALQITSGPATCFGDSHNDDPCGRHFTDFFVDPALTIWYGGNAHFFTPPEMASIIESVTPMVDPNPRMECWAMDNKHVVLRYAGKRDGTNINIKVDTDP